MTKIKKTEASLSMKKFVFILLVACLVLSIVGHWVFSLAVM
ncbi:MULTISPECIES: hypothetical protein [unclassified Rhizobium]|nr:MULTISPECIES: hypothetical protein [unclassified Rhizobium]